jgi:hypothetical protein
MGKTNGAAKAAKTREVEVRDLPVKLTDAELLERGDTMAATELLIETLGLERAQVTSKINAAKKERAKLAHTIDCGTEDREIRCEWHEDFSKNVFRLKRQDTGEEVDTRPMTALDRTSPLFPDGDGDDDEPPPRSPKPRAKKAALTKQQAA